MAAFFLPLAPINSRWWNVAVKINGDLPEEIGWPELAEIVARIRNSLPPEERAQVKIPRWELRRSRRHQSLRPGAGLAARHLLYEFVLGIVATVARRRRF